MTLRRLLALLAAQRARIALAIALGALTLTFGAGLMAAAGYLIVRAAERPAILSLTVAIVVVRVFGLGRPLSRYLERLSSHDLALRVLARVRAGVLERIEPLAPAELEGYRDGDLLGRMVADVDALQDLHLRVIAPPVVAFLAALACVAFAAALLPAAGLVLGAGLLVAGVPVPALTGGAARRAARRQATARGVLAAELVELLQAAPELVVCGQGPAALTRVREADATLVRLADRDALAGGAADALVVAIAGATVCGVLAVAAHAVGAGTLDRVDVALLALLGLASFDAVAPLGAAVRALSSTLGAGRRVLDLVDRTPAVTDPPDPRPLPPWPFAVSLEHVSARDGVLEGVDLRIEPGRHVALVGASGAGKTTVVDLLVRFLDPVSGRVALGGRDIRTLRQEDVRRVVAVAGQASHLFAASIRENVLLGRPDATDDEVEEALRAAQIADWVDALPDGRDTQVGEEGRELSGGQRQRVALARALLSDAPVLVLDEPTAHLDPATARALVRDVLAAARGRSLLLITHRPEGLEAVDEVVRLDGGRVRPAAAG